MKTLDTYLQEWKPLEDEADALSAKLIAAGKTPPKSPRFGMNGGITVADYDAELPKHLTKLREMAANLPAASTGKSGQSSKPAPQSSPKGAASPLTARCRVNTSNPSLPVGHKPNEALLAQYRKPAK